MLLTFTNLMSLASKWIIPEEIQWVVPLPGFHAQ